MLFNSLAFLLFLTAVTLVFYLLPQRYRWLWLLAASVYFYTSWEPRNLAYLVVVGGSACLCGRGIARSTDPRRRRAWLTVGLVFNLGLLVFFKYYDFVAGQVLAGLQQAGAAGSDAAVPLLELRTPVGFSFYTFSVVTYLVAVYRGQMDEARPGSFALYVAYFPKIFAGPIERARHFLPQVSRRVAFDPALLVSGLQLVLWGLFKKVVIADNLAPLVEQGFGNVQYGPPIILIVAVYAFAFQIYCDFSGYTDIAIGASRILGYDLMENFRRPYLSRSSGEFWASRWHISLATWFRDFMYIPLGGGRVAWYRVYFNLMAVFMVSGLWHAGLGYGVSWAFLVWGAVNGLYAWAGRATGPLWHWAGEHLPLVRDSLVWHVLRVLLTFHLITFSWIFFRAESVSDALVVIRRIWAALPMLPRMVPMFPFSTAHYMALALVVVLLVLEVIDERRSLWERLQGVPVALRWGFYYAVIFALLILGEWHAQEFIYMQF